MLGAFTIMADVLACLCEQLSETEAGTPCFCGMILGTQAMPVDSCLCTRKGDNCGTAWVRLDTAFPSANFPQPDLTPRGSCQSPLAYRINVGVVRCIPGLDSSGRPPGADTMILAAQRMVDDQKAAYRALSCCRIWGKGDASLGGWLPVGAPDGNCAGGYWTFSFRDL